MKKLLLLLSLYAIGFNVVNAQEKLRKAFSDSYTLEANEKYADAISALENVYSDSNYILNFRLGWLYYSKGDYIKSKSYYLRAINLNPNGIEARFGYIYPLAALENWDEVIGVYQEILKIDPNNTTALYRLGYIYFLRNEWAIAKNYLSKVTRLYPFDYDSNVLLGQCELKQGNIESAKKYYQTALLYYPDSEELQKIVAGL